MINEQVVRYIEQEHLFTLKDKVLVALSGGADSVALLYLLHSAGYTCEAAHCNFHLRGEESNRDEEFVSQLCKTLKTPLHITHFNTSVYAAQNHLSIEMAARELRYEWFAKIKEEVKAKVIAVAHHQDDSIETILLNLIRGTGINGLLGIRPKNGDIVRPLLCINRKEVIEYLNTIHQDYVTDSTNLLDEYTRNKIRLNIIPMIEEINPSFKEGLINTSQHLNETAIVYNKGITEARERILTPNGISIEALQNEPAPSALLFEILSPLGFNSTQINDILNSLNSQSGKLFIGKGWRVIKDRNFLLLDKEKEINSLPCFELIREEAEYTSDFILPREKEFACFDAEKLNEPLSIRKWQKGDTFFPFGMKGKKRLSDYMTDRKFPINRKEQQWVLCCGDRIAWLIGERIDNRFRVEESTQKVVVFRINQRII